MRHTPLRLFATAVLALGLAAGVHAQQKASHDTQTAIPVWNKNSGKVEAILLLEPTGESAAGARWRFGTTSLDAAFGLQSGDSLGLLCNQGNVGGGALGALASNCMLASLGGDSDDAVINGSRRLAGSATLSRPGGRLSLAAGSGRDTLPAWLAAGKAGGRVEQNDLAVFGQKDIGREGFVSIGGTFAKARLIPIADASPALMDQWNTKTLSVGGGYGAFSASVIGRVVDVPGQPGKWEGLGVGLTWRTPWSGQLTVGAENVVTRGKNPFAPNNSSTEEGTVPYVRYEQEL